MSDYLHRIQKLQQEMAAQGARLTVLAGTNQMRYLTGWREGGGERFVGLFVPVEGEPSFVVPAMNAPQAAQTPAGITHVLGWNDGPGWHAEAQSVFEAAGVDVGDLVLIDDEMMSVHLLAMQSLYPGVRFLPAGDTMTRLRQCKTPEELAAMDAAAQYIDTIFEESLKELREGMTELDLAEVVLSATRRHGSQPSFAPLICFGENAALPHHHTGNRCLKRGDVVIIDIGCQSDYYASDITRTVAFGEPTDPDVRTVYEIVHRAHWAARDFAKPGVTGDAVDAAARQVITEAGYGPQFVHRTGHGIGLSIHEPPNIVQGNTRPLQPGMCFSVEPGIYLPGRFGVRIENIVTVTEAGVRSLNSDASPTLRLVE
jgi:Xaa-Pro aminopeptidase